MISVVIPVHNEIDQVGSCLRALQRQRFSGPYELIVVDNGSTDGSTREVSSFAREHPNLEVRLIHEPRPGIAVASQTGFEAARYPVMARTDADTLVDPEWLATIARRFRDERVAALCGHVGFREPTPLILWLRLERVIELHQRLHIRIRKPHFYGFNFAVRREVFRRAGGFDTRLRLAEDLDLSLRIQGALRPGERIEYAPEMRVYSSSRRYHLNPEFWRYTVEGYWAYVERAWRGRVPHWMCVDGAAQRKIPSHLD